MEIAVDGRLWNVTLQRTDQPGRFHATLDGRRWTVDALWIDSETLSLLAREGPAGELDGFLVSEIGLLREHGQVRVSIRGRVFTAVVGPRGHGTSVMPAGGERRNRRHSEMAPTAGPGRQLVRSPMPGRIVRVLVAPGDRVAARQSVVVVEAMKMENELRSPKDGVVSEVIAREGATVEAGAALVVIDEAMSDERNSGP